MTRGKALALAATGIALLITARFLPEWHAQTPPPAPTLAFDRATAVSPLPAQQLTTLGGGAVDKSPWQGKVVVANYWATWCAPCRAEMPEFSELHQEYAARGVQFLGITLDTADKVNEFIREVPVSYPLLLAPQDAIEATVALGNAPRALPFTVVIDRAGKVAAVRLGRYRKDELAAEIRRLL